MGKYWEFFAGGNTKRGFFSYYDYIMPQKKAKKIICIKGGPGTGKSTLMKKAAEKYKDMYDVELMHCSSDPDSLDGVVVPDLGLAVIDGTAPHVVDPKNPGSVDMIFNAGDYWCEEAISAHHDDIVSLNNQIADGYKEAYYYLELAGRIKAHQREILKKATYPLAAERMVNAFVKRVPELREPILANEFADDRKLFMRAITPKGIEDYCHIAKDNAQRVYTIKAYHTCAGSALLEKLDDMFRMRGFETQKFYSPFAPESEIEHLYVTKPGALFTVCDNEAIRSEDVWDLDEYVDYEKFSELESELQWDESQISMLLEKTINRLKQNKKLHDDLEVCYIPYIDFNSLTNEFMNILP